MKLRQFIFGCLAVANLSLLYTVFVSEQSVFSFFELQAMEQSLKEQIISLDEEGTMLSHEIRLMKEDESFQKQVVRDQLHYLYDNEVMYLFPQNDERVVDINS